MPKKWYSGEVIQIKDLSPNTKLFKVKVIDAPDFQYLPGQFLTFDLPTGEKRLDRWRSYSIASFDEVHLDVFDLVIVHLEKGKGSTYFHQEVSVGSILTFKGAEGSFLLPSNPQPHKIVMICTGTGIAPFRAMIQYLHQNQLLSHIDLHLIFGTRWELDILFREEFEKLSQDYPKLQYDICLSRQNDWTGSKGYVHQVYEQRYNELSENTIFYLCGWSSMVDEAAKRLSAMGYLPSQVKYEIYG